MKKLSFALLTLTFNSFASSGREVVLQCPQGISISVDTNERRNLEIVITGAEAKRKIFFSQGALKAETLSYFFGVEARPGASSQELTIANNIKNAFLSNPEIVFSSPVAAIGHVRDGVFYPSQFKGMLVSLQDQKEIRILRSGDMLNVTLYNKRMSQIVSSFEATGCR